MEIQYTAAGTADQKRKKIDFSLNVLRQLIINMGNNKIGPLPPT